MVAATLTALIGWLFIASRALTATASIGSRRGAARTSEAHGSPFPARAVVAIRARPPTVVGTRPRATVRRGSSDQGGCRCLRSMACGCSTSRSTRLVRRVASTWRGWVPTSSRSSRPAASRGGAPAAGSGVAQYFENYNGNKRSVVVDVRTEAGRDLVRRMAKRLRRVRREPGPARHGEARARPGQPAGRPPGADLRPHQGLRVVRAVRRVPQLRHAGPGRRRVVRLDRRPRRPARPVRAARSATPAPASTRRWRSSPPSSSASARARARSSR